MNVNLINASSTRKGPSRGVVRAVNVRVTVHATVIESENVEASGSRMTRQKIDVALLAQLMRPACQQLCVVRSVRGVTYKAVLLHRGMPIEQRPAFLRMTGVAKLVSGMRHQHALALATVRVVAGSASHFQASGLIIPFRQSGVGPVFSAKQMRRALE